MSKPPILAIHGMWSVPAAFDLLAAEMARSGYTIEAADYRTRAVAHVGSLSHVGLADYVEALEEIANALPEKPIIIGHSLGGLLAQLLAVKIQPRALILLSTAPAHGTVQLPRFTATKSVWDNLSTWNFWKSQITVSRKDALYGIYNNVPADEAAFSISQLQPDSGRVLAQIGFSAFDSSKAAVVDYVRLTCPTLVLCGEDDRITPCDISRATARRMTGPVAYKELDGFGHWIVGVEGSPIIGTTIKEFLAAHGV
jgi:pimeloyl-ACP methyl ester carboxylesterase